MRPLSRNPYVPALLVISSLLLTILQITLDDGEWLPLVVNWLSAGILSIGIWSILTRNHLSQEGHSHAIYISWPVIATALNLEVCTMGINPPYSEPLLLLGLLIILGTSLRTWQNHRAPWDYIVSGLMIGIMTFMESRLLVLLPILMIAFYHMRSWSGRNFWSLITGTATGVWVAYCASFILVGETYADQQILDIGVWSKPSMALPDLTLWQWLYIGLMLLGLLFSTLAGLIIHVGASIRTHSSIILIAVLTFIQIGISLLDLENYAQSLGILALYMSIQLSLHNVNMRSSANEWWTVTFVSLCMLLVLMPMLLDLLPDNLSERLWTLPAFSVEMPELPELPELPFRLPWQ